MTGDAAYGDNCPLRGWLEDRRIRDVLAVACDHQISVGGGKKIRADTLACTIPTRAWQPISCGPGSKGDRLNDWALTDAGDRDHHLLIRRSMSKPGSGLLPLLLALWRESGRAGAGGWVPGGAWRLLSGSCGCGLRG